jgi:amino acid permease
MFFVSYGAISAYMVNNIQILEVQMLVSVFISFGIIQEGDERWLSITLSCILLLFVWIPTSLPKEITFLRYGSTLCIIGIIYITLVLAFEAPKYITRDSISEVAIFKVDSKFFSAVGVTLFAFDGGQNIPSIQNELVFRNKRRMKKVICRGMFIVTLSYVIMGVLGYLTNVTNTPDLIVFREPISGGKSYDWPMVIARIFVAIYLNMNLPIQIYPTRLSLERMIWGTEVEHKKLRHYALTVGILISNLILAILLPDAIFFFKIVGAVFAMPICIIFPAILYCKTIDSSFEKAISMLGVMVTTLLAVGCIADTLISSS